jgi:hypothetical protein
MSPFLISVKRTAILLNKKPQNFLSYHFQTYIIFRRYQCGFRKVQHIYVQSKVSKMLCTFFERDPALCFHWQISFGETVPISRKRTILRGGLRIQLPYEISNMTWNDRECRWNFTLLPLKHRWKIPDIHWIGDGLDMVEKRKIPAPVANRTSVFQPVAGHFSSGWGLRWMHDAEVHMIPRTASYLWFLNVLSRSSQKSE